MNPLARYARWLHTGWPAGHVERLPVADERGRTNVPGVYVAGDLRGIPLLKFAADSGARVVADIAGRLGARAPAASPGAASPGDAAPGDASPGDASPGDAAPAPAQRPAEAGTDANEAERSAGAGDPSPLDLVIVGAGVAGMAAALEARRRNLRFRIFESSEPFFTIVNFPRAKPIFTYPRDMTPAGTLRIEARVKEELLESLRAQTVEAGVVPETRRVVRVARRGDACDVELDGGDTVRARFVVCALGRSGHFRRLGVPGEDLPHVCNRLHDPRDFCGRRVVVVGGGDSAAEAAIALAGCGADVTLVYRGEALTRPKPENVASLERLAADPSAPIAVTDPASERVTTATGEWLTGADGARSGDARAAATPPRGRLRIRLRSRVREITPEAVDVETPEGRGRIEADVVFVMVGREAPLDFFRRAGVRIRGEWTRARAAAFVAFLAFCTALYDWKSGGALTHAASARHLWPFGLADGVAAGARDLVSIVRVSAAGPAFWYTLAYSILVVAFGVRRIRRRRTPYVTAQTTVLMLVQVVPLFLLPEIVLPWLDAHGLLPRPLADALFPAVSYGHGREFWRAYGLVLAWPLNVYNVFTDRPLGAWLVIAFAQTFVLIPAIVVRWGKGAYCGWICSCGALAETLGDTHREKMPHGARWKRLELAGQAILFVAFAMLILRVAGWLAGPGSWPDRVFPDALHRWKWGVDVALAGVVGYGTYFWFSGRVWCRFFCPLAALMHVYARLGRFRILAERSRCISCNVCTSVCHQGIDVMNFANKGLPMADPECVRCSACVQSCPTGVLTFGRVDRRGRVVELDRLAASPVQMREQTPQPKPGRVP